MRSFLMFGTPCVPSALSLVLALLAGFVCLAGGFSMAAEFLPDFGFAGKSEKGLSIDGLKTFELKQNSVSGDLNHYSLENFDEIPGFHFDQSLQLKIDGEIIRNVYIKANLDDSPSNFFGRNEKDLMVFIDGKIWDITLGDFWATMPETEFTLFNKKLKGFKVEADFMNRLYLNALISRSEGVAGFFVSQGLGHQQEYQMPRNTLPVVENSEVVYIDGKKLRRGSDYTIDYEDGSVRFDSHLLPIEANQRVNVEYQYDESQAAYKKNLVAVQIAGRLDKDNALGFTFVQDAHDTSSPLIEIDSNTSKPMSHQIFDLYLKGRIRDFFTLRGEISKSVRDFDTLSSADPLNEGTALKLSCGLTAGPGDAEINYRRIEPTFVSVGRRGFATLGQEGLVGDISQLNIRATLKPFNGSSITEVWENSHTNILDIPGRIGKDYDLNDLAASFDFSKFVSVRVRDMREGQKSRDGSIDSLRTIQSAEGRVGYGFLQFEAKGEVEETGNRTLGILDNRIRKGAVTLSTRNVRKVEVSMGFQDLVTERGPEESAVRDVENLSLNLNVNPNRKISAVGVFLNRKEKELALGLTNSTTTADLRLSLTPCKSVKSTIKYKETHTRQTLREKESETRLETPITTVMLTANLDLNPFKTFGTSFDIRTRDIIDETTNEKYSSSNSFRMRMKYAPFSDTTSTFEYNVNLSNNDRASDPISRDRTQVESAVSLRKSFKRDLSFETRYSEADTRHRYDPENTNIERGVSFRVQKQVTPSFSTNADYTVSMVYGLEDFLKSVVDSGVTYSSWKAGLRMSLRYRYDKEFRLVDKVRHEGTCQVDYNLSKDTKFIGEVKMIARSPDDCIIGKGYSATLGKAKVEVRF